MMSRSGDTHVAPEAASFGGGGAVSKGKGYCAGVRLVLDCRAECGLCACMKPGAFGVLADKWRCLRLRRIYTTW